MFIPVNCFDLPIFKVKQNLRIVGTNYQAALLFQMVRHNIRQPVSVGFLQVQWHLQAWPWIGRHYFIAEVKERMFAGLRDWVRQGKETRQVIVKLYFFVKREGSFIRRWPRELTTIGKHNSLHGHFGLLWVVHGKAVAGRSPPILKALGLTTGGQGWSWEITGRKNFPCLCTDHN